MGVERICAIVVTYNRKQLLMECINKLLSQTLSLDEIIIIDNASTDNTISEIRSRYSEDEVTILPLEQNVGGAGGFYEGLKYAKTKGYEWIWILDDDTIPELDCIEQLIETKDKFSNTMKPLLLASRVNWIDGTLHPMNLPTVKNRDNEKLFMAARNGCISIRSTSFVSLLINRSLIEQYGLPIKEYFIWNDDLEYTSRILKNEFGVVVPKSVVKHKTKVKYTPIESAGARYYYEVRNKIWLLKTTSFSKKEKIRIFISVIRGIFQFIKLNKLNAISIKTISKGLFDGLFMYNKYFKTAK
ncbi:glycosyltransferase family 2 protein [Bacillus sp. 522_BSPC]|uniref:glycosyltransferase family 2 protein n=1 Tax=Bacillus sp. 522_BSPC TaxID=1579338 RepID=UPI0006605553|nr:glycosyltransferase family 2 protein [Bacillus sp. 522_BSPC]